MYIQESPNTKFVVKKLPALPKMDSFYNVKIDKNDFIFDRENLMRLKADIEDLLRMN